MVKNERSTVKASLLAGLVMTVFAGLVTLPIAPTASAQTRRSADRTDVKRATDAPEGITPFNPNNIVVCRVGDGAASLSANAAQVFLDEYTTTGTLVRSVAVPSTTAGARLTVTGNSTTECEITRSADGRYIIIPGYDAAPGAASPASATSATVPRVIGRVDSNVNFNLSTTTTSFSAQNIRSAASTDGSSFWAVGSGTGTIYTTLASTGAGTLITSDLTNSRTVNIFGGQLYTSSGSGALRMNTVGTGTPTTGPQPTTALPGIPTATVSFNGFFFTDLSPAVAGNDTLYIADDQSAGAGTIRKYTFDGTTWTATGTIVGNAQYRGLTGFKSGTTVTLFATRAGNELVSVVDPTGYNGVLAATPTSLATAATNTGFRGVALAPLALTAAGVTISGRVVSSDGRGIRNASVSISGGALAEPINVRTGTHGEFSFADIPAGNTYAVTVSARRFTFESATQIISVQDNISEVNFFGSAGRR